ncbi:hypothetical protein F4553_001991 [Allocatelliglobosispora scoriae]|uniref:Uncharacterized protein n=1 Tax=Allocatelliglobosispora scoriae TaxID=643052 RepID=A0A841BPE2_9ACTN|nr:hypothetical protein [Allocatelliglobosispora scoriae]MBB5868612.1 hypothetical protein [Allocatelliglobosispora scoriae]
MTIIAPSSVGLRLPEGWLELDPRADDLMVELRRAVRTVWDTELDDKRLVGLLTPLAVEVRRLAATEEIVLVGVYADVIPVEGGDPLMITAHAVLAISPPLGDARVACLELLGNPTAEATIAPVTLPAGDGVRDQGTTMISHPDWDEAVPAYHQRFCVPVPGVERLAVLTFLTPNLALRDAFTEVFDAIAETLTFYG